MPNVHDPTFNLDMKCLDFRYCYWHIIKRINDQYVQ